MGKALEIITGYATAPGSTFTALTMSAGNSLTVRNFADDKHAYLITAWSDHQTAGNLRIRSPRLHDNVQGIRLFSVASEVQPLIPLNTKQILYPQDTLVVEITGSGTAGDIESACLLLYYEDIPGIDARLIDAEQLASRMRDIVTVENTLSLGTTGGYTGEEAINAEFDLLEANTDYAILGYLVSAECACVRWRGVDTGNLGVGGPGNEIFKGMTRDWFVSLSRATGLPCIPVINSSNRSGLLIDGVQDENGVDTTVTTILAMLSPAA